MGMSIGVLAEKSLQRYKALRAAEMLGFLRFWPWLQDLRGVTVPRRRNPGFLPVTSCGATARGRALR